MFKIQQLLTRQYNFSIRFIGICVGHLYRHQRNSPKGRRISQARRATVRYINKSNIDKDRQNIWLMAKLKKIGLRMWDDDTIPVTFQNISSLGGFGRQSKNTPRKCRKRFRNQILTTLCYVTLCYSLVMLYYITLHYYIQNNTVYNGIYRYIPVG